MISCSGCGRAWAIVRGGGDSLGYRRGRGQGRGLVSGFIFLEVYMILRWL